ncbi:hypothetical protein E1B28_011939 [Marasmius oreades]|uniref:SWIM-type domain-containing protein n=1 Tax=Marasmius oreades TaxID=181124 RepID=A0A9P7RR01_9AGAR|nr:uncharacterized protein E1B28_011939 [Marasmius oreades]KAG7087892.1 hypothetical protein E1B28_011939 [Marasmius oreades]
MVTRKRKASELKEEHPSTNNNKKSRTSATQTHATHTSPIAQPGPSNEPSLAAEGTPKSKGKRKGKEKQAKPESEKRLARYRGHCPINVEERLDRALAQRFFLIHREREEGSLRETFTVSGSTGNVYTVVVDNLPRCDCPDALKGNHCKHILFVFFKVFHLHRSSSHWYQKALLNSELQELFDAAPAPPQLRGHGSLADDRIIEAWKGVTGRADPSAAASSSTENRRIPTPEDDCPICYDTMHDPSKTTLESLTGVLEWCKRCGNAVHKPCWNNYLGYQRTKSTEATKCVWCRAPWYLSDSSPNKSGGKSQEGYVNLAGLPGMEDINTARDYSTYHSYSRRRYSRY